MSMAYMLNGIDAIFTYACFFSWDILVTEPFKSFVLQ